MTRRLKRRLPAVALLPLCLMHALAASVAWADDTPTADTVTPEKPSCSSKSSSPEHEAPTAPRPNPRTDRRTEPRGSQCHRQYGSRQRPEHPAPVAGLPRPAINDGNDAIRPASLRGMSPDQVLVLVDGKRYHTTSLVNYNSSVGRGSAPVDLNSIPIAAIDHIEVLRDGAAAGMAPTPSLA